MGIIALLAHLMCVLMSAVAHAVIGGGKVSKVFGQETKVAQEVAAAKQLSTDIISLLDEVVDKIAKERRAAIFQNRSPPTIPDLVSALIGEEMQRIRSLIFNARLTAPLSDATVS